LLIEDNEERFVRIEDLLNAVGKDASAITRIGSFDEGMQALADDTYDVCLANLRAGGGSGLDFVRKAVDRGYQTPVVLIAAADDLKVDITAMAAGAADFLVFEELSAAILVRSIRHVLARYRYIGEARDQWKVQGSHEDLTELCKAAHEFADTTSHRFRTPLAVIKGFAKILADGVAGDLNEGQKEYVETILVRVDDLNAMINDLFETSSLEAGVITAARSKEQLPQPSAPAVKTPAAETDSPGAGATSYTPQDPSRKTVLIADDDDLIIQALTVIIEGLGLNVILHAHYIRKDADAWDKLTALIRQILNVPSNPSVAAE